MALQQATREGWPGHERTRVLVVEEDRASRDELVARLLSSGCDADGVETSEGALHALTAGAFDVLLTREGAASKDASSLLESVSTFEHAPRPVLIADATPGQSGVHMSSTCVRVLSSTYTQGELMDAVRDAASTPSGLVATLTGVNLIDVLQLLHFGQRTVLLRITGASEGRLYFDKGEVVHATYGRDVGAQAVRRILQLKSGRVSTEDCTTKERSLHVPLQMLLLDVLRFEDERGRDSDASFDEFCYREPSIRPSALSLGPRVELVPEVEAACCAAVEGNEEIVACAAADLQTVKLIGQHTQSGVPIPTDRLAIRAIELLAESVRANLINGDAKPNDTLDVQLTSADRIYLARTLERSRGATLIVTRRSTSAGMARALMSSTSSALESVVERALHNLFGSRGH